MGECINVWLQVREIDYQARKMRKEELDATIIVFMNWHMQAFEIYYTNPVYQSNKYKAQDFIREWIPELKKANNREVLIICQKNPINFSHIRCQ